MDTRGRGVALLGGGLSLLLCVGAVGLWFFSEGWAKETLSRSPGLLYEEALRLHREESVPAALELARRALALEPGRHEAHFLASLCLQALGRLEDADREAELAIRHAPGDHPNLWRYLSHLGFLEDRLGRRARAMRDWNTSAFLYPDNPQVWAALADGYGALGESTEARRTMAEAVRLAPESADYRVRLAGYLLRENAWDAAAVHLEIALELDDPPALAYRHLAFCRMQQARLGDAQHYFEEYLERAPGDKEAAGWLLRVRQRLKG